MGASAATARSQQLRHPPGRAGAGPLIAIAAFGGVWLVAVLVAGVPRWTAGLYGVASLVCFMAYAQDKAAARRGGWRTSESSLLLLGLVGGWPGAILAQRWLRHKSSKASFQAAFRATVLLNVGAFAALAVARHRGWVAW